MTSTLAFTDLSDSIKLLDDPLINNTELFTNSSCALSPSDTVSLSPDYEYNMDPDPLGLNELFDNIDDPYADEDVSTPIHGSSPGMSSVRSTEEEKSEINFPRNAKVISIIKKDNSGQAKKQPVQVAVLEASGNLQLNSILKGVASSIGVQQRTDDGPCMNKNAVNARENRQKKKKYVADLEKAVTFLSNENKTLKEKMTKTDSIISKLEKELRYVKSVLANQEPLANILGGLLKASPDIRIRAPLLTTFPSETTVEMIDDEAPSTSGSMQKSSAGENAAESDARETPSSSTGTRTSKRKRVSTAKDFSGFVMPAKKPKKITIPEIPTAAPSTSSNSLDHNYNRKPSGVTRFTGGICLHIANNDVSVEMCSECSESSHASRKATAKQAQAVVSSLTATGDGKR